MKVNTTKGEGAARAMTGSQIEKAYGQAAGAADEARKRVLIPRQSGGGDVVEVGFNGRMFLIRRGETVELPAPLIEILEHAKII